MVVIPAWTGWPASNSIVACDVTALWAWNDMLDLASTTKYTTDTVPAGAATETLALGPLTMVGGGEAAMVTTPAVQGTPEPVAVCAQS